MSCGQAIKYSHISTHEHIWTPYFPAEFLLIDRERMFLLMCLCVCDCGSDHATLAKHCSEKGQAPVDQHHRV